jgi:predicted hotdog family 3-hydroxylacyl-ACP dehydratase
MSSELTFPVSTSSLEKWIPHRPPMVWVDQVLSLTEEGGTARVNLDQKDSHFFGEKGLRESSFVEFLAQAYAFTRVCQSLLSAERGSETTDKPLAKAFLVGIRDLEILPGNLPSSGYLIVRVRTVKELSGVIVFGGSVETSAGLRLASGTLKVYSEAQ